MYRQGDVLLVPCRVSDFTKSPVEIPKRDGRIVLAYGEVTGHAHAVKDENATMVRDFLSGRTFLKVVDSDASVVHEEHNTIVVPPGEYEIVHQRQQNPRDDKQPVPRANYD